MSPQELREAMLDLSAEPVALVVSLPVEAIFRESWSLQDKHPPRKHFQLLAGGKKESSMREQDLTWEEMARAVMFRRGLLSTNPWSIREAGE